MRTEKELLILLRKKLIEEYNKGRSYLYLCNIAMSMMSFFSINYDEYLLLKSIVIMNRPLFIEKFNAYSNGDSFWDGDDFHNRYQALNYLIERYEEVHYVIETPDPIEAIKFRMEQKGLIQIIYLRKSKLLF